MVKRSAQCKFPVARIKKIMQADEDVGKVAQATPVLICKSIPYFPNLSVDSYEAEELWLTIICFLSLLRCEKTAKALELFMASIVEETVKETRSRGAKKMTPYHV